MPSPMCVKTRDGLWHALTGKLDPDAWQDEVRCGYVIMRFDHQRRAPTCPECSHPDVQGG